MVHFHKALAAICTAAVLSVSAASAASISLVQSPTPPAEIKVGDMVSLTLVGIDMPVFDGFQIDVTYDRDFVSYQGASFNPTLLITADQLANAQAAEASGTGPYVLGNVTAGAVPGFSLQGDVDVVTLQFKAIAAGIADFTVAPFVSSVVGPAMFSRFGVPVFSDTVQASIIVVDTTTTTPIPLPASVLLLGAGVLGLFGSRSALRRA
jgi:hypothetical protein